MAERTSRPWSSVPRRKSRLPSAAQAGGVLASMMLSEARSKGLCGDTTGAKTAASTTTSVIAAAIMALGERQKLYQTSLSATEAKKLLIREVIARPLL